LKKKKKKKKERKTFWPPGDFWFDTSVMLFSSLGGLFVMKTLKDERCVVIKASKLTVLEDIILYDIFLYGYYLHEILCSLLLK